jgi:hypothetical protein
VCVFHVFHCTYPFFLSCRGCQQHQLPSGTFLVWSVEPVRPGYVCIYIYTWSVFFGWMATNSDVQKSMKPLSYHHITL